MNYLFYLIPKLAQLPIAILLFWLPGTLFANETCANWPSWVKSTCQRLQQVWTQGHNELYFTGYAWHNRYAYDPERVKTYNENAWGGGIGKGFYDEKGDWHALYAFGFSDSHRDFEPIAGYGFLKTGHVNEDLRFGAGLTVFVTARRDMYNNIPFPGALPLVSASYRRAALMATYIPGSKGAGNVLFLFGRWVI